MPRKKKPEPAVPPEEAEIIRKHYRKIGRQGGKARAEKLTPERRKEIADEAIRKRWEKQTEKDEK